jgi:hypothetical protein
MLATGRLLYMVNSQLSNHLSRPRAGHTIQPFRTTVNRLVSNKYEAADVIYIGDDDVFIASFCLIGLSGSQTHKRHLVFTPAFMAEGRELSIAIDARRIRNHRPNRPEQ